MRAVKAQRPRPHPRSAPQGPGDSPASLFVGQCWGPASVSLFRTGALLRLRPGQILVRAGDRLEHVYYVEEGALNMFIGSPGGAVKILGVAGEGGTFGETFALMPEAPVWRATAVAAVDTAVRALPRETMRGRFFSDPEIAADLAACVYYKNLVFAQQIEDLSFRNVGRRIASLLSALIGGSPQTQTVTDIDRDTIAAVVAAHRVTVSNALRDLEDKGLITVGRRHIYVVDPDGLRREAAGTDR